MMQRVREIIGKHESMTADILQTLEKEAIKREAEQRLFELERLAYLRFLADIYDHGMVTHTHNTGDDTDDIPRLHDPMDGDVPAVPDLPDSDIREGVG